GQSYHRPGIAGSSASERRVPAAAKGGLLCTTARRYFPCGEEEKPCDGNPCLAFPHKQMSPIDAHAHAGMYPKSWQGISPSKSEIRSTGRKSISPARAELPVKT